MNKGEALKEHQFTWIKCLNRFCFVMTLVYASYNLTGLSYYHWVFKNVPDITLIMSLTGLILLIGWVIVFTRAAIRSLGLMCIALAIAFFGSLVGEIIDWGLIPTDSATAMTDVTQTILCFILVNGLAWSNVRHLISGQIDANIVNN